MNQIEKSRESIGAQNTYESINSGCMQRIANATETMARSYISMQDSRDRYKGYYEIEMKRSANYRGQINKLKKAMKAPI